MPGEVLEVRGLSVSYGATPALVDVDLAVAPGEMLALLGPSGSGKSTILHTVAGFIAPSAGEVWLGGERVATPGRGTPPEDRGTITTADLSPITLPVSNFTLRQFTGIR
jgi:ABC-type Fe3+/spermidine/putrescine transport system ATPase subunit